MASVITGVILETLPQGLYKVKCDDGQLLTASLTGAPKQTIVRVIPGDRVSIEVSPLDPSRGRIKSRLP